MAVDECCGSVVFAEEAAVDVVEPISRDEPVPAGGTRETLQKETKRGKDISAERTEGKQSLLQEGLIPTTAPLPEHEKDANQETGEPQR